ncbi:MAG: universal stress protein [Planctomycetota bacterium]|nr:MAG: universal stress protein [Planctomycetota bacterium]
MNLFADKNVVVPIDFSEESDRAVDAAIATAGHAKRVTVVHVAPPLSAFEPGIVYIANDEDRRQRLIEAAQHRYRDPKYQGIHVEILFGDPGHKIAEYAQQHKAGLIVMPSHGRTGLAHLLIGSVAERVVRLAHCPVLVLRS